MRAEEMADHSSGVAASDDENFNCSIRSKLCMVAAARSSRLFSSGLNPRQSAYVFEKLKERINYIVADSKVKNEFQFGLTMMSPNPNIFLNVLLGWRSSVLETERERISVLDKCIHAFYVYYPESYDDINRPNAHL